MYYLSFIFPLLLLLLLFSFPWKSSDHNCFQWGWSFDIDCQQGRKLSSTNFALKKQNECCFDWRGPIGSLTLLCSKIPADLEPGFRLALELPGKTEALGILLWGDRETDSSVSRLTIGLIYPHPLSSLRSQLCYWLRQSSTRGQCQVYNWNVPRWGKTECQDYYSEAFLLLFFSIGTASVLDLNAKRGLFKERRMEVTARKGFGNRLICGHSGSSVTRSGRQNPTVKVKPWNSFHTEKN